MKIRTGFVSNSSSSSFCIIGFVVRDNIKQKIKQKIIELSDAKVEDKRKREEYWGCSKCGFEPWNQGAKFCEKCGAPVEVFTRLSPYNWEDDHERYECLEISWYSTSDYGDVCGFSLTDKSVDEVQQLHDKLIKMFGTDIKPEFIGGEYNYW